MIGLVMSEKRMFTLFQIRPNNLADFSRKLFSITIFAMLFNSFNSVISQKKKFHQIMKITVSHDAVTSHRLRRITLKLMLLGKTFKTQGETNCSAAATTIRVVWQRGMTQQKTQISRKIMFLKNQQDC